MIIESRVYVQPIIMLASTIFHQSETSLADGLVLSVEHSDQVSLLINNEQARENIQRETASVVNHPR